MLNKKILVLVSLLLISFLLVGCAPTVPEIGNQAPSIGSSSITTAQIGETYTYNVEATDPDGDVLTYFLTRNPSGMGIDRVTGLITWTPNSAGSFGVTVMVSDGVKSATQSFTITITPVAELTEIVVTPDTMTLEVGGEAGTFTVTANYSFGDPQDVTGACVYTQPTTGVVEVTAGSVTAVKAGTDTILISYEGKTANIAVTVSRVRIPMTITVDLPTFRVGEPYWFTIKMTPNDDSGEPVKASFGWPISGTDLIVGILETDVASDVNFALISEVFQTETFTMEDTIIVNFRGTFTSPGTYLTAIEVKTFPGNVPLCSQEIAIVVGGDPLEVGDSYGGGKVAYTDETGHGLISSTADATSLMAWSNIIASAGTGTEIGTGQANTIAIVGQTDCESGAAHYCYTLDEGGYTDWFLPSKNELRKLYDNRVAIGDFNINGTYWSSSEDSDTLAWVHYFGDGGAPSTSSKSSLHGVRAVRAF